jgi:flagellar hook-length control protein FliK
MAGASSTATAGGAVAPPVRIPHRALAEAILNRARSMPANDRMELRFALEPEDLGPVRVQIVSRGDRIEVRIVAHSGAAVDALGNGLSRLTSQLVEAGFRDPAVQLALDDSGGGGARRDHGESGQSPGDRPFVPEPSVFDASMRPDGASAASGRLDRTA